MNKTTSVTFGVVMLYVIYFLAELTYKAIVNEIYMFAAFFGVLIIPCIIVVVYLYQNHKYR